MRNGMLLSVRTWSILLLTLGTLILWPRESKAQIWSWQPALSGGTSDPTTVNENTQFSYTVYGFDKDTISGSGQQYFDSSLVQYHSISSMSTHSSSVQGDNPQNGTRTWVIYGRAVSVTADTYKIDTYWYDDFPSVAGRNDPGPTSEYVKLVYVRNVPS